ncbi:MAG: hypothetical protein ACJ789_19495 [Thermomicrobiales bacterium]
MHRRQAVYPITILLSIATAIGIFAAGWVVANPTVADPGPPISRDTVQAFYAGINQTIRTGDATALGAVVDDHVVTHGPLASFAPDRAGLTRYLLSLHATNPAIELKVTDFTATDNRAMVSVSVAGADDGTFLGNALTGLTPWGDFDAIRVNNHKVVELWSDATGLIFFEPLAHSLFALKTDVVHQYVALDRLSIPWETTFVAPGSFELRFIQVVAGTVTVEAHDDYSTRLGPASSIESSAPDIGRRPMAPGDLIGIPSHGRIELENTGRDTATVLVLGISRRDPKPVVLDPACPQGKSSSAGETAPSKWWTVDRRLGLKPAPSISLATNVIVTIAGGNLEIDAGRAAFTPNAALSDFSQGGVSLLLVNSGTLDVVTAEQLAIANQGVTTACRPGRLGTDSVGVVSSNAHVSLHNPADGEVILTVFTIHSVDETPTA